MTKLYNKIGTIVSRNVSTKTTILVENIKLRFTEKSIIVYTYDNENQEWFKEITINADMIEPQITNLIVQIIKFN